jgi:type I restriction-modification system DNA methylase subunit
MMGKLIWLDVYYEELSTKPDMGEIEWRSSFIDCILKKGLGYPSKLVRNEKGHTDVRILSHDNISHIVFETKISDSDLDKGATLEQARGYLQGGETYLVLASPHRLRVFTPKGNHVQDISITETDIEGNATFWQLSYEFMLQKGYLVPFREGDFDYCYIPVHTDDGFAKFVTALQLCGGLLLRYLRKAWVEHENRYSEYQQKLADLQSRIESLQSLPISEEERKERLDIIEGEINRLRHQYKASIEVMEVSFPAFQRIQPYSKDVKSQELLDIYLADITYAALNRILFVRIAEDKGLLERKISNGGISIWRRFVTYLKENYQDLIRLAYQDAGYIYEHFFEEGIFDWYVKGNSELNETLENILFLLNSFDLSKVDRDTLGDLYQEYLPPEKRKKLGEFYTPREVIDYILRHIGWKGEGTLIDPACGSGGFLVRAANIMLDDLKQRGLSEEARLGAMKQVIGLDINPFATHIAELNLLFLILDIYLKAKEEAKAEGTEFRLSRLPIYTIDSLLGTIPHPQIGGTTRSIFIPLVQLAELEEAIQARDKLGEYGYLVMNPPYVRNERLPEEPRDHYRRVFNDVAAMNADIFTYFMRKTIDWLKDSTGKLGVIVSLGLADARANEKLRKFLSSYTIERVVPLEWCEVFVSNVNPMLLFIKKTPPPPGHKLALVHGISSLSDLDQDKGEITYIEQDRWLDLAPDRSWRVEVRQDDLPILKKMKSIKGLLEGQYGMTLRGTAEGRELISEDTAGMSNPYPLLDGREVKAWSVEWQGRYIDYQPKFISDPKTLDFFKSPKVVTRRISLTSQAAVDDGTNGNYLTRDTVMVVRSPIKELNDFPFVIAALMNSLPIRYYAFIMLRSGVVQKRYSTFYPRVIGGMPTPEPVYKDEAIRSRLDSLSLRAHEVAKEMANGDKDVLKMVDSLIGKDLIPFAYSPKCDLSGYFAEIEIETAQVSDDGELTSSKLGKVKGEPAILQYMVARASLEGKESLSKKDLENFPVPKNTGACVAALEQMELWAQRKPALSQKLTDIQTEIDDLVLSTFTVLSQDERQFIKARAKQFPLNQVLVTDEPGVPTKRIPVKYWKTGERYK